MQKTKHISLTITLFFIFISNSFSQEYEKNKLFIKLKTTKYSRSEKNNERIISEFKSNDKITNISKVFKSKELELYYIVEIKESANLDSMLLFFKRNNDIDFSEKVPIYKLFFTPNDPQYVSQWHLSKIQADQAWNISQGLNTIKIAVVDDGFLLNHEDLSSKWYINPNEIQNNNIDDDNNGYIDDWRGWDAAENDKDPSAFNPTNSYFTHGTHVAGIVGASTNNSLGIASISNNCKLIPVKIGNDAQGSLTGAYAGVEYAIISGAQVINMSWGGSGFSATYQALFNLAKNKGIVCVAAAGNSSTSMPMYPAAYNNVISVASSTNTDVLSSFTNYGSSIDVTAPGSNILSTLAGNISSYGTLSGTSMASPLVAGLCGLMISNNNGITPDSVEACLKRSCDNIDSQNPLYIGQFGAGRINAFKSLQCTQKAPISDFEALDTFQCTNKTVNYVSKSSGIQPLTYSWFFPGGTLPTSSLANPQVTYSTPGLYSATLTVTNNFGSHSTTKSNIVRIGTPTAKLSGRKYTTYGTNTAIISIEFTGNPPYAITLSDGSNNWSQSNISSNPYFFSIIPQKDTSFISISNFSDKNCTGTFKGLDTIMKISNNNGNNSQSYNCLRVKSTKLITENTNGFNQILPNNSWFGSGVNNVGDWDGDGINDVMIGAGSTNMQTSGYGNGRIYFARMNSNGTVKNHTIIDNSTVSNFIGSNNHLGSFLFVDMTVVGDIDGDGVKDLAVGGHKEATGVAEAGSVYIIFMNINGSVKNVVKWANGQSGIPANSFGFRSDFGNKITPIGDWDGDGIPDISVGAVQHSDYATRGGAFYIATINSNGTVKQLTLISGANSSLLANKITTFTTFGNVHYLGDINGDGTKEFAVGASYTASQTSTKGRVYILSLNNNGTVNQILSEIGEGTSNFNGLIDIYDGFGFVVEDAGDIDKNGVKDLIIGCPLSNDGGNQRGGFWIVFLNTNGTVKNSIKISQNFGNFQNSLSNNGFFGYGITNIGDLDGNKYDDYIVGNPGNTIGAATKGAVWVLFMEDTCSLATTGCENSFLFNGTSNNVVKIEPQNGASFNDLYNTNGFTWECWFNIGNRTSNSFTNTESLISAVDANLCEDIGLHFNWPSWPGVGKLNWVMSGQSGCSVPRGVVSTNMNFNANTWYHAAGVMNYSSNTIELYVNGVLVNSKSLTIPLNMRLQKNIAVTIGNQDINYNPYSGGFSPFKGNIDEVRFWNKARSASEILSSYKNCLPASTPNLVAYFKGDEGNGSKTTSFINNNFIGTLQNGTSWSTQVDSVKNCTLCDQSNDCDTTNLNVGKVLHLDFNGNTLDKSGNNNHATNYGATPVSGKDGLSNTAYHFDGVNDYMKVLNSSSLNPNNPTTLTVLIKPRGFNTQTCHGNNIISTGYDGNSFGIRYSDRMSNPSNCSSPPIFDKFNFYGMNSGLGIPQTNQYTPYVDTANWFCLVLVKDIDSTRMYVNSKLVGVNLVSSTPVNVLDWYIGRYYHSNPNIIPFWLNADIDDIRIYNRTLSASEIKGYCGTCNTSPPISIKCDTGKKYNYTKCFNDTIQLNIGKGKNHQWSPAIDLSNGTIQNPKCFAKNSTQYLAMYIDSMNCQIIDTFQVNLYPSNKISLKDSIVCIGDSISYSLGNNGSSYIWTPSQYLSSSNQQSSWIKPLTDITYNISYIDNNGCKILDTFTIKTKTCCTLKAEFDISDSIICKKGLLSIFNKSKNITTATYNWIFTNISPSQYVGYSPPSIPLSQTGIYRIQLKTNNGICEDSMTRNIYVINVNAKAGMDSTFCTGSISNLKIGDTNSIADYKYSWSPTLGLDNPNISTPTVNISQNIKYELSVYDPYTGCIALDTISLTINNNLDTFNYIDTLCDGDTKVFFGQNIKTSGTYQYYEKDNKNCDKAVHILKIYFRKVTFSSSTQKVCNFYTDKNGVKHTDSFEYNDSTYINGCLANIHTTKIKILKTRYEELNMTGCYKMKWKGITYIDSIKKIDSLVFKENGCDTLVQYINLNIVKKSKINITSTHANPLNYGEEIILQAFGSNNYKWNTGDEGFQLNHTATKDFQFYVIGYNNILCPDTAYYNITLSNESAIELPDIFSPNDDGKNDIFKPNFKGNIQIIDLVIFNRWGEKMYESQGNHIHWDGKYKNESQPSGVYVYILKYKLNEKTLSKKGSFVLVR